MNRFRGIAARGRIRPGPPVRARSRLSSWRQSLGARRRLLSASLAALAVAATLHVLAPRQEPGVLVVVAARDLAAGSLLTADDVRRETWPRDVAPRHRLARVGGELLTAVRAGEALTDTRIRGPALLRGQGPEIRSMAVQFTDPVAALLRAGDRIDVIAGPPEGLGSGSVIAATDLLVLAVGTPSGTGGGFGGDGPGPDGSSGGGLGAVLDGSPGAAGSSGDGVVIVAVDTATALQLRGAMSGRALSVLVRHD